MSDRITRRAFTQRIAAAGAALAAPGIAQAGRENPRADPFTVALAGAAHIHTGSYVRALRTHGIKVKSVWDADEKRAKPLADRVGATVIKSDHEIWTDPEVKGVLVLSETSLHRRLVTAGAKAGKHLFVEKPLGITGL